MRLSHVLSLLAGGAVVALTILAIRVDPPQPRTSGAARAAPDPRLDRLLARLDRIETQTVAAPAASQDADLALRLDRIESMIARIQAGAPVAQDSADVPTESLRVRAKALSTDLTRAADAIDAWEQIADRTRDPERKAEAWFEQGELYRDLEDYDEAARAWQKVVDTVGLETPRGQTAAYQLGWAQALQQDARSAYRTFQGLAAVPNLPKAMDSAVRLQLASFARANGDVGAARREYRRYIDDYANDDAECFRNLAKTAAEQLQKLP